MIFFYKWTRCVKIVRIAGISVFGKYRGHRNIARNESLSQKIDARRHSDGKYRVTRRIRAPEAHNEPDDLFPRNCALRLIE